MATTLHLALRRYRHLGAAAIALGLLPIGSALGQVGAEQSARPGAQATVHVSGVIRDSATGRPITGATIDAHDSRVMVATGAADSTGHYTLSLPAQRTYALSVRRIGYEPARRTVTVTPADTSVTVDVALSPVATTLAAITVTAGAPVVVDIRSGIQTYQQRDAHVTPTTTTSQIVQQAVAGAARAPTGEVHIRGQHGEFTYYVDDIPVAAGISGSLNELFDPGVAARIDLQTGGWDAEYGNKSVAVIKVATRIPDGGLHWQAAGYGGSFGATGQTVTASTHAGALGMLLSLTHQETGMRREPLLQDPSTGAPLNFHNHGADEFVFGQLQYAPADRDRVTLDLNASRTSFEVPFDSSGGLVEDDREADVNAFVNLGWRHRFGDSPIGGANRAPERSAGSPELFTALYLRRGTLTYAPGTVDQPAFAFYPDTVRYTVSEDRSATTAGVKVDYTAPLGTDVTVKTGLDASLVSGREAFATRDSLRRAGPGVTAAVHGGDVGVYAQSMIAPSPHWEFRVGLRLDHHVAPLAGDRHQLSPRARVAYFPDAATSVWLYYGRLFVPANVEDFHVLAAAAQGGAAGLPTIPERDNYFEAGVVHRVAGGVVLKAAGYYRRDAPAVDDNTLPGTAVTTTVNIARVQVAGIEAVVELHPRGPLSGYVNAALSHASAHGPITGGFLPTAYPAGWFDQDHDQRLSVVASGDYTARWGYVSATGICGSGLTNGHPDAAPNGTGLFAFNSRVKVAPSFILNASAGAQLHVGGVTLWPEVFVDNLFNLHYLLKGAFTSGPSVGRPRTVQLRLTVKG
ncbi:MAG TPA: TonB-dependent receptor [Gemmatimonadales bacterium]|nr:TonB-dependent receptor [Gemmatimonadales bacterium]